MIHTEQERLEALDRLNLMDSEPEPEFNDLVGLASDLCGAPISLLTLLDEKRQWFKAARGVSLQETDRTHAFCHHALMQEDIFVVSDATRDTRFAENPYVVGDPNIRFYASALIRSPEGAKLGTLCIIDTQPRELSWREATILEKLARQATSLIELRERRRAAARFAEERSRLGAQISDLRRRIKRLAHLAQVQGSNSAAFIDNGLDALRGGRHTKKDITDINARAALHRDQVAAFSDAIGQLAADTPGAAAPLSLAPITTALLQDFAPLARERGSRIAPLVPADLELLQDEGTLRLILGNLLRVVLTASERAELSLLAQERDGGVEFLLLLPEQNILELLQRYLADELVPGIEHLMGKPFHVELSLTRDLVELLGGSISVQRLGKRGTSLSIQLPNRA